MKLTLLRHIMCWMLGCLLAVSSSAFAQVADEGAVKAAFVYNFILFVEWPSHADKEGQAVELCVNHYSPMASALHVINDKPVKKNHLRLRRLTSLANMPASCRVVYLDSLDRAAWQQIRNRLADTSVLTITDDSDISAGGAMIFLFTYGNRIVFDIDHHAVKRSGLTMSSKLLRLARSSR